MTACAARCHVAGAVAERAAAPTAAAPRAPRRSRPRTSSTRGDGRPRRGPRRSPGRRPRAGSWRALRPPYRPSRTKRRSGGAMRGARQRSPSARSSTADELGAGDVVDEDQLRLAAPGRARANPTTVSRPPIHVVATTAQVARVGADEPARARRRRARCRAASCSARSRRPVGAVRQPQADPEAAGERCGSTSSMCDGVLRVHVRRRTVGTCTTNRENVRDHRTIRGLSAPSAAQNGQISEAGAVQASAIRRRPPPPCAAKLLEPGGKPRLGLVGLVEARARDRVGQQLLRR